MTNPRLELTDTRDLFVTFAPPVAAMVGGGDDLPTVQWTLASRNVGEGDGTVLMALAMDQAHSTDIRVEVSVEGATGATGELALGVDFALPSTMVTIPAGQITADLPVTFIEDAETEPEETATLRITRAYETTGQNRDATIGGRSGLLMRVAASDPLPIAVSFSADLVQVIEGDTSVELELLLTEPAPFTVRVPITTTSEDGGTIPGDLEVPTEVLIPQGETQVPVTLRAPADTVLEGTQNFTLELGDPGSVILGRQRSATVRVLDASTAPATVIGFEPLGFTIQENGTPGTIEVVVKNPTAADLSTGFSVQVSTQASSTAVEGTDFSFSPDVVSFAPNETRKTVTITPIDDANVEDLETIILGLENVTGGGIIDPACSTALGRLEDDDQAPSVVPDIGWTVASTLVSEGVGTVALQFTLTTTHDTPIEVSIGAENHGGAGQLTLGTDFAIPSGPFVIPAGTLAGQVVATIVDDADQEGDETADLVITSALEQGGAGRPAPIVQGRHTITVRSSDAPNQDTVQFSTAGAQVGEGTAVRVDLQRSEPSPSPTVVSIAQISGTATRGRDYSAAELVTIPPGQTSVRYYIAGLQDYTGELAEDLTLQIQSVQNGVAGDVDRLTVTINDLPNPTSLHWSQTAADLEAGDTLVLQARVPVAPTAPLAVSIAKTGGQGTAVFPSAVTIQPGTTSVDVPLSKAASAELVGASPVILELTAPGYAQEPAAVLDLLTNDAPRNEPPVIGLLQSRVHAYTDAGANAVRMEVVVLNRDSADLSQATTISLEVDAASPGQLGTDVAGPSTVTIPAGSIYAAVTLQVLTGAGALINIGNPTGLATVDGGKAQLTVTAVTGTRSSIVASRGLSPTATSEDTLCQVVIPFNPVPATLPEYRMNGVLAEVLPMADDWEVGKPGLGRVVSMLPSRNGPSSPTGTVADRIVLEEAAGTPLVGVALKPCNLEDARLTIIPAGVGGARFEAMPFSPGHSSIRNVETRRDCRYLRETRTLVEFQKVGASPAARENVIWLAMVIRSTRADLSAELLDVVLLNARWKASDNAYEVSTVASGPTHFASVELSGISDGGAQAAELIQQRPGQFEKDGLDRVWLTKHLGDFSLEAQHAPSGMTAVRRLCVYKIAEVSQTSAQEIVARRDFGYAEGDIGFHHGGFGGYASFPSFTPLPSIRSGIADPWDALDVYGDEEEARMRAFLVTGTMASQHVDDNDTLPLLREAGWFKGYGPSDRRLQGEWLIDMWGHEAPSSGMRLTTLLEVDGTLERYHAGLINLDTNKEATPQDVVQATNGYLPTEFAGVDRNVDYIHPHMRDPNVETGVRETVDELAPYDLPWNSLEAGQSAPFRYVTDWQARGGLKTWGPHQWTHSSRAQGPLQSGFWMMDDAVSEMGLRFVGLMAWCGWSNKEVNPSRPWQRFIYGIPQSNLHRIRSGLLGEHNKGRGYWTDYEINGGYAGSTPRDIAHACAAVSRLYLISSAADRAWLDGDGNPEDGWAETFADVVGHVTAGTGVMAADAKPNGPAYNGSRPPVWPERTGSIPAGPQLHPGVAEHWPVTQLFHHAYWAWALVPLTRWLRNDPTRRMALERNVQLASIWDDGIAKVYPDAQMPFGVRCATTVGSRGQQNPRITEEQARNGAAFWKGDVDELNGGGTFYPDRKPWSAMALLGLHFETHGRLDNVGRLVRRQFNRPTLITNDQALASVWAYLRDTSYLANKDGNRFAFMGLPAVAALQKMGAVTP